MAIRTARCGQSPGAPVPEGQPWTQAGTGRSTKPPRRFSVSWEAIRAITEIDSRPQSSSPPLIDALWKDWRWAVVVTIDVKTWFYRRRNDATTPRHYWPCPPRTHTCRLSWSFRPSHQAIRLGCIPPRPKDSLSSAKRPSRVVPPAVKGWSYLILAQKYSISVASGYRSHNNNWLHASPPRIVFGSSGRAW